VSLLSRPRCPWFGWPAYACVWWSPDSCFACRKCSRTTGSSSPSARPSPPSSPRGPVRPVFPFPVTAYACW
jgi:hypothetical protein